MYIIRFLKGTEKGGLQLVGDQQAPTKREALGIIRRAGAAPSKKFLEGGCVVRTAILSGGGSAIGKGGG